MALRAPAKILHGIQSAVVDSSAAIVGGLSCLEDCIVPTRDQLRYGVRDEDQRV
jgi:hypothetical protein